MFDAYGKCLSVINYIKGIYFGQGSCTDPYKVSTSGVRTMQLSNSVLDRVLRVMDSQDYFSLTENACRASTPSRESIMSKIFVLILTRYSPRKSILHNHHS